MSSDRNNRTIQHDILGNLVFKHDLRKFLSQQKSTASNPNELPNIFANLKAKITYSSKPGLDVPRTNINKLGNKSASECSNNVEIRDRKQNIATARLPATQDAEPNLVHDCSKMAILSSKEKEQSIEISENSSQNAHHNSITRVKAIHDFNSDEDTSVVNNNSSIHVRSSLEYPSKCGMTSFKNEPNNVHKRSNFRKSLRKRKQSRLKDLTNVHQSPQISSKPLAAFPIGNNTINNLSTLGDRIEAQIRQKEIKLKRMVAKVYRDQNGTAADEQTLEELMESALAYTDCNEEDSA